MATARANAVAATKVDTHRLNSLLYFQFLDRFIVAARPLFEWSQRYKPLTTPNPEDRHAKMAIGTMARLL